MRAIVGHVGDTRLYKLSPDRIEKVTRDHSPVGEREDAGEVSEREAMRHPRRNEVYRDVGSDLHEPGDPEFIDVERDSIRSRLGASALQRRPDRPDRIVDHRSPGEASSPGTRIAWSSALIDAAKRAGGKDNVTVVYVEGDEFKTTAGHSLAADTTRRLGGVEPRTADHASSRERHVRVALLVLVTLLLALSIVRLPGPLPGRTERFRAIHFERRADSSFDPASRSRPR